MIAFQCMYLKSHNQGVNNFIANNFQVLTVTIRHYDNCQFSTNKYYYFLSHIHVIQVTLGHLWRASYKQLLNFPHKNSKTSSGTNFFKQIFKVSTAPTILLQYDKRWHTAHVARQTDATRKHVTKQAPLYPCGGSSD